MTLSFIDYFGERYQQPKKVDLSFLKNLKTLELFTCPFKFSKEDKVDLDDLIDGISNLEKLETLVIDFLGDVIGDSIIPIDLQKQKLDKLYNLKTVIIIGDFNLDASFATEIPNLKTLILDKNIDIIIPSLIEGASFKVEHYDANKYVSYLEHDMYGLLDR